MNTENTKDVAEKTVQEKDSWDGNIYGMKLHQSETVKTTKLKEYKMEEKKMYAIEKTDHSDYYGSYKFRFHSLFNGTRGSWVYDREKAIAQGERHQEIVLMLYKVGSGENFNSE